MPIPKPLMADIPAEQGVLGSIILEGSTLHRVTPFLRTDHFFTERYRTIYETLLKMNDRGMGIDLITLTRSLENIKQLAYVGGMASLTELLNSVPSSANIEFYARSVEETALNRQLLQAGTEIAELAYKDVSFTEKQSDAYRKITDIKSTAGGTFVEIAEVAKSVGEKIFARIQNPQMVYGLETGFSKIDSVMGGFQPSLILVGARPSMGKSAWMLSLAYNVAKLGKRVVIVSLEMTKEQMTERLISYESGIATIAMQQGGVMRDGQLYSFTEDEKRRIKRAKEVIEGLPILLNRITSINMLQMRSGLIERVTKEKIDLLGFDYLNLTEEKGENRNLQVGKASRDLKLTADDLGIPVVALCQLSRGIDTREEDGHRAHLSDLRDSGELEANADLVFFPHRIDYWNLQRNPFANKNHKLELPLAKDRLTGKAPFMFDLYLNPVTGRVQEEL